MTTTRIFFACLLVAAWLALCIGTWLTQRRKRLHAAHEAASLIPAADGASPWLVAYASQTGQAEEIAWQTARLLHTAGVPVRVVPLSDIHTEDLVYAERVLFVVSTYGEGDPPDNAALFAGKTMRETLTLSQLHYGLLMLGDREYRHFCGFGRGLQAWLQSCDAQPLFDPIAVSNGDSVALHDWQHELNRIAGTSDAPDWQGPAYQPWRLAARRHLNPGSAGGPVFHLELEKMDAGPVQWEAGDLAQILAPGDPKKPREYSVASIPSDGRVHLLIRQERHTDGSLGIASGWLTEQAPLGATIDLRLRSHGNFRIGDNAHRPLILIGNGTGLAGLRSHLRARAAIGKNHNWLIFGERQAAHDFHYRDEIETWQQQGLLAHADIVFSRDQEKRLYVQDRLRERADILRVWLANDAALYVCGSLEGMAGGVEAALKEIVGEEEVTRLIAQGRYRRDVY